jgi:hypothetical protein
MNKQKSKYTKEKRRKRVCSEAFVLAAYHFLFSPSPFSPLPLVLPKGCFAFPEGKGTRGEKRKW